MDDLVSILIPVYNREQVIYETLISALSQTYRKIEIIVVDNASTDSTWEIIQRVAANDNRIKAFRNEINIGPVRNWKRCVDEAMGRYGKILWSDDLVAPDFLDKCLPLFDDDTAFVYSSVKVFDDKPENGRCLYKICETGHFSSSLYIKKALRDDNVPVSPGCAIFRLQDIKDNLLISIENKIGSDFAKHAIGNDLLLFLLTARNYKKVGFVSDYLSFFREHPGSISVQSDKCKLVLNYLLVKSYFAEHYKQDMKDEMVANAWFLLKKYPNHYSFGFENVSDFFLNDIKIKYWFVLLVIFRRAARLLVRIIGRWFRYRV